MPACGTDESAAAGQSASAERSVAVAAVEVAPLNLSQEIHIVPSSYLIVNDVKETLVGWITQGGRRKAKETIPGRPERSPRPERPESRTPGLEPA